MGAKQKLTSSKLFQYFYNGKPRLNGQVGPHRLEAISRNIAIWKNTQHVNYVNSDTSTHYLYFSIEDLKEFKPHSIRRTGATILAGSNLSLELLMIAGNWKSASVARAYISNSLLTKRKIAQALSSAMKHDFDSSNLFEEHTDSESEQSDDECAMTSPKKRSRITSDDGKHVVMNIVYNITCGSIAGGSVVSNEY